MVLALIVPQTIGQFSAEAAVSNVCDGSATSDQNQLRVAPSHGKVFYIDSSANQFIDSAYASYIVTNLSSTVRDSLWLRVDTFTGGSIGTANPFDATQSLSELSPSGGGNDKTTSFILLKANGATNNAQSHVVRVFQGKPGTVGATEIYSCTYSFAKVAETIRASANKITSGPTATSVSQIGSTMTVTVEGSTGTVGAGSPVDGSMMWISPVARSSWPTNALRLESTAVNVYTTNGRTTHIAGSPFTDQLRIPLTAGSKYYYTNVYTFRIVGKSASASTQIVPIAQISSGTQIKHTTIPTVISTLDASQAALAMTVTKSASTTATSVGSQTYLDYSVSLTNRAGAADADAVSDFSDVNLEFVPGSALFNGVPIVDPVLDTTSGRQYIFTGPFSIPAGTSLVPTTRQLTYSMRTVTCETSLAVSNSATATIGQTVIGSSAATFSSTTVTGTCGDANVDVVVDDPVFGPVATTSEATGVTTAVATLNGLADPNGISGEPIAFSWGTDKQLVGATSVSAGTTTDSATAYATSANLSGLQAGTTYYFRLSVGSSLGDIFSFTTANSVGTPTAVTTAATNVTLDASAAAATLNGQIDPNLVNQWGAKAKFEYAREASPSTGGACTAMESVTTTGYVQNQETDTSWADLVLTGAFPTDVSWMNTSGGTQITGLTQNVFYCYRIIAYYDSTDPASRPDYTRNSVAAPNWISFRTSVKSNQTIDFINPTDTVIGATEIADASASSGLSVIYTSNTPEVCSVTSDGTITPLSAGVCSITASQPGNDDWNSANPVTTLFLVSTKPQTISFPSLSTMTVGESFDISATATSALTVTLANNSSTVCSLAEDGTVTALEIGECSITATQPGDATWSAADSVTRTFRVKSTQSLDFGSVADIATGSTEVVSATSSSGLSPTYSSLTPHNCSVDTDGTVTALNTGTCTIAADQVGNDDYHAATQATLTFMILSGPPVVITDSLSDGPISTPYSATLEAGGGNGIYSDWTVASGSLPAGMTLSDAGVLSGTPSEAGIFNFSVTVSSDSQVSPERSINLTITKWANVISVTDVEAIYGDGQAAAPVSVTSELDVTLISSDDAVVTVDGVTITFVGAGETTVEVTSLGNDTYVDADPVSFTVTVSKKTLSVTAPPGTANYGDLEPTLGEFEILGFVFDDSIDDIDTLPTCESTFTSTSLPGSEPALTCHGGSDNNYLFNHSPNVVDVNQLTQTIEFPEMETTDVETPQNALATASSDLGVEYSSLTPDVCTVNSDGVVTPLTPGVCTISAAQSGSAIYEPVATPLERSFTIIPLRPVVDDSALDDREIGAPYSETLSASRGYSGEYGNWQVVEGSLPVGLLLNAITGEISGTPTVAGDFTFGVQVDSRDLTSLTTQFTITINKLTQSISAPDVFLTYGDPKFTTSISSDADMGFELTTDRSDFIALSESGEITIIGAGTTRVTVTAFASSRYTESSTTFTVVVSRATLNVSGKDYTLTFDDSVPADVSTADITGFAYTDDVSILTQLPVCSTTYLQGSTAAMDYAVTCSGGNDTNYAFEYEPGTIQVDKARPVMTLTTGEPSDMRPSTTQRVEATTTAGVDVTAHTLGECSWNSGILSASANVGSCDLTFVSPETEDFIEVEMARSVIVTLSAKLHRDIILTTSNGLTTMSADYSPTVIIAISPNEGSPTLTSLSPDVCQINPDRSIQWVALGECELESTLLETSEYYAGRETLKVIGTAISRALTLHMSPTRIVAGEYSTGTIVDSANIGNAEIQTLTRTRCTIHDRRVTPEGIGTCTVRAVAESSGLYASAISNTVKIVAEANDITVDDDPDDGGGGLVIDDDDGRGRGGTADSEKAVVSADTVTLDSFTVTISGFAPNSLVTIESTGSKTMALLPVTGFSFLDNALSPLLASESSRRLATPLATASSVGVLATASSFATDGLSHNERHLASDTGFRNPTRFARDELNDSASLSIAVSSSLLSPGKPFATIVTSSPRIASSGLTTETGAMSDVVAIPLNSLEPGVHNVRLLGKRQVGTMTANSRGQLTLSPEIRATLDEFDSGTNATIRLTGTNSDGGARTVVMTVPLPDEFPWWLVALVAIALGICAIGAFWRRQIQQASTVGLTLLATSFGSMGILTAWLLAHSTAVEVTIIMGVVGLVATLSAWLVPASRNSLDPATSVRRLSAQESTNTRWAQFGTN